MLLLYCLPQHTIISEIAGMATAGEDVTRRLTTAMPAARRFTTIHTPAVAIATRAASKVPGPGGIVLDPEEELLLELADLAFFNRHGPSGGMRTSSLPVARHMSLGHYGSMYDSLPGREFPKHSASAVPGLGAIGEEQGGGGGQGRAAAIDEEGLTVEVGGMRQRVASQPKDAKGDEQRDVVRAGSPSRRFSFTFATPYQPVEKLKEGAGASPAGLTPAAEARYQALANRPKVHVGEAAVRRSVSSRG